MQTLKMFFAIVLIALFAVSVSPDLWAGTTGKIKGRIIDKKTKEPLPGAVIQIEGTTMGAAAGPDGHFFIINVPPKVYSIMANLVGYNSVKATNVKVMVDNTTVQNFMLEAQIVDIPIVQTVTADRDVLQRTITQNMKQLTAENIKEMPVTTLQELLTATVGVVERRGELHVRGGRGSEITYIIDGVQVKDPLGGRGAVDEAMNISSHVIEDLQIIKGGFDAEYGNAMSGIINITTKAGSEVTKAHAQYLTDDFGTEILNDNSFNFDRLEFNISGPEPLFSSKVLPALGIDWFDGKLTYSVFASGEKTDEYVNYKDYFTPAVHRDFKTNSILGLFDLTDRMNNEYETRVKLNWSVTPSVKLIFNYTGSWDDQTRFQWNYRDTPATAPVVSDNASKYSLQLTHTIDKSTFYELTLSRFKTTYLETPGDPNNPGERIYPDDFYLYSEWEYYYDRNGNGVFDAPEPFINVNGDTSWYWGGPFYTVGDAYIADPGYNWPLWPPISQELDPEFRGVDPVVEGLGNSTQGFIDSIITDWNGNGLIDFYESEPFVDLNGDGKWNAGDYIIRDTNGNGRYDPERGQMINVDAPESYVDGDRVLGEPFTDVNHNGVYDPGIDLFISSNNPVLNQDLNYNSKYDGPQDPWSPGVPFEDLNGNGLYDPSNGIYDFGEPFIDRNQNGKWDNKDGFFDRGHQQWAFYQKRASTLWSLGFKINKQFNKEHYVKSGLDFTLNDLNMADLRYPYFPYDGVPDGGPYADRGVFRDFYNRQPITGAYFIQDRMEYGAMIANLGLRYDFFIQSSDITNAERGDEVLEDKSIAGSKNKFSPRIGFSYPISDKATVKFNYGHFYQLPTFQNFYRRATQASNAFGIIGNENLDFEKTIQYEFGIRYRLSDDYVLSASGFYKDIFGILNSIRRSSGPITRNVYENSDYARTRGFEVELEKTYGNYIQGFVNYEYSFSYGKSSSESSNYLDDYYNRSIPIQEFPLDWDVRHQVSLNMDLAIPPGEHPQLFGLKLPDNWGANIIWQFGSGFPFTPDRDYPGISLLPGESPQTNSLRYPASSEVDVKFYKRFPFLGLDYTIDLWVNNLFDNKNINRIYGLTGRYDTNSKAPGAGYVFEGSDSEKSPTNLGPGRNIRLGIGVDF